MKILAIDTSTGRLCVGVSDGQLVREHDVEYGTRLSRYLVPCLERILDSLGWRAADVDLFACGAGPGSFTGIRIGMACIKGLAWSTGKPVAGIPSLDIIAANAAKETGTALVATDAKRGLFYFSAYSVRSQTVKRKTPYMLLPAEGVWEYIQKRFSQTEGLFLMGNGVPLLREKAAALPRCRPLAELRVLDSDHWKPRGHICAALARKIWASGKGSDALRVEPMYLYPKECQIRK